MKLFDRPRLVRFLMTPGGMLALALLAVLLFARSLGNGMVMDDFAHRALIQNDPGLAHWFPNAHDWPNRGMFSFVPGDAQLNRRMMEVGILPWWSAPDLKVAFWRPLTQLTHQLDYALWPDQIWLIHLQNLAWLMAAVVAVAGMYRELIGPGPVAAWSAVLFALADVHSLPASWIANRHVLIATVFVAICLRLHHRGRDDQAWPYRLAAIAVFAGGLSASEAVASAGGFLVAYALFLDHTTRRARILSLLPYVLVGIAWRINYNAMGYGARNSGLYSDPVREPIVFIGSLIERLPVLLGGSIGLAPIDILPAFPRAPVIAVALVCAVIALACVRLFLRCATDKRQTHFWLSAWLLSAIPFCAVVPSERNLAVMSVAVAPLLVAFLLSLAPRRATKLGRVVAALFVLRHFVLAPPLSIAKAALAPKIVKFIDLCADTLDASRLDRPVIILNAPDACAAYAALIRAVTERPTPPSIHTLASGLTPVNIERIDARSFQLEVKGGWLSLPVEQLLRSARIPFKRGESIQLPPFTATVEELTDDGRPLAVRFDLSKPASAYSFVRWKAGKLIPMTLPPPGQSLRLPNEIPPM